MSRGIASMADVLALEAAGMPDLPASTYEMIGRSAKAHPERPALSFFLRTQDHARPEVWSYRRFFERITQAANLFHGLGIGPNDVVAFVLPSLPETHFTIWGGQAAGIAYAVNPLLEPQAIADLLVAGGATVLVTLAPFPGTDLWCRLQGVLHQVPALRHVVLVNLADRVRGPKKLAARWLQRRETRRLHGRSGLAGAVPDWVHLHDFNKALRRQPADRLVSGRVIQPDDLSSYFCTGGTTGLPKIAMRRHRNEVANAWSAAQFLGDGISTDKNIFCGLPLFHVNAAMVTGLTPFSRGAHVILGTPQGYRGEGVVPRFWELVHRHHIHFFSGVPTLYATLMQYPTEGHDISSLEYGLCGAAPMPVELMNTFQERTGLKILEGYGLTEGTCVSSTNPPLGDRRLGSIGIRLPLQRMKTVLLDDQGAYVRDCDPGEVGTILIEGANVFAGYKEAAHNQGLWVGLPDGQCWLNTGDLGRMDEQGYFYLTGRKKELIIRGGHNIDPASIEEPLHKHPAVQLAAAIGWPDEHAGELPVAYVQLKPGASATEAELLDFAQRHITERAALPKAIRVIEQMPLTGVGKIFKPALKEQACHEALSQALRRAGIDAPMLSVSQHPKFGLFVQLTVHDASVEEARAVLGRFPFQFAIEPLGVLVDRRRIELPTSALRTQRSPN